MAVITGDASGNLLDGTTDADEVSGLGGNDTLNGLGGADTLAGGDDDDTYIIDASDILVETAGIDTVHAAFSYELLSGFERLVLLGGSAANGTGNGSANTLTGNDAANRLSGGDGSDMLIGNAGADTLNGGSGNDTLLGGDGKDILIYEAADTLIDGGTGADWLKMKGSGASLDLTAIANDVIVGIERVNFIGRGSNLFALTGQDLLDLSDTSNRLQVRGDAADRLEAAGSWDQIGNITIGNQTYARYEQGTAKLWVDTDIDRSGITLASLSLDALDGANGFRLDGIDAQDYSGTSVASAGDVNGDGFDDLFIGTYGALETGNSYVVFGKANGFSSSMNLSSLDGSNGFRFVGGYTSTSVVSAGDVNGDGFDDLFIGSPNGYRSYNGSGYVVLGKSGGFASSTTMASTMSGIDLYDFLGRSVSSAGDVNGDGFDDLIIGASGGDPGGDLSAGESYVIFGKASGLRSNIDLALLDGRNGFRLDGIDAGDRSGFSVASAGDVNSDGFDDLIVGAWEADPGGDDGAGESYVVFGKPNRFASSIDLASLDGSNGFRVVGIDAGDYSGGSVSTAGDVNGDGFDDLIIGARGADPGRDSAAGESYVVFGSASRFASTINLATLDGADGFRLTGTDAGDGSGRSVASAGDVNGDGFDDLIIGVSGGDPGGNISAGESYVVFGSASRFASSIDLATLDGTNGFRLNGTHSDDGSGRSVASAGDVNGDGFDDLIVGAPGYSSGGASYVVFGGDFSGAVTHLGTGAADMLIGTSAAETFVAGRDSDSLTGGGGADVFNAGAGNDLIQVANTTFREVDGGSGNDTLAILGGGRTLDLTALANNRISGIERIDITGSGDNSLELSSLDLFDLSDSTNRLKVDGNDGDTVGLVGAWDEGNVVGAYQVYTRGAATILIDTDIFVT